ncbi:MAG: aminopeptidase [Gemmatimonadota bacterium]|nr:aminopeptidase [Gemmatimonadota bacterium]
MFVATAAVSVGTGCSPVYVIKAGWAEAKILKARRPLPEVILAPETDERTRGKLTLAREAREFAINALKLDVGDSYTTYTELDRDTLAMVLSAAYQDRLASRTWWFPIVGRVPYRGFFDLEEALREQRKLEDEGFDTMLRPTSAFSTLGWFSDPLLSTIVRYDEVELITTIIHELSHNHLFIPGQVRFNESFATWVGRVGAIEFFCTRPGGGPDTVWCNRARDRWHDVMLFSRFIDGLVRELEAVYGDSVTTREDRIARRQGVFERHQRLLREEVRPRLLSLTFSSFDALPLNNAILLSRMLYYHRLPDFDAHLAVSEGTLETAIQALEAGIDTVEDPFELLPTTGTPTTRGL